jgi:hemerythrin-like domain-containing protein
MAITLNAPAEHTFTEPLGLLTDCHRRVEKFLRVIVVVAETAQGDPLTEEHRAGLETALRYFRSAAPLHTADEEVSLFPRMRACNDPEVAAALERIDGLEADHKNADMAHKVVDDLAQWWLNEGTLPGDAVAELISNARGLRDMYQHHIALEDEVIFPLAGRALDARTLAQVGREMAERRGLDPDTVSPIGRCASRRAAREAAEETVQEGQGTQDGAEEAQEAAQA